MANFDPQGYTGARTDVASDIDQGLRAHMLRVYNYMATGLALTGVVAFLTFAMATVQTSAGLAYTDFGTALYNSPLKWVVMLSPLAFVFFLSARIHKMSFAKAQTTFWMFTAIMGLALSSILLVYTGESITKVFFITAAAFAGLSLYGYTTKKDLSAMGSFMVMGLIGIIIAMVVNMFLQSAAMHYAISVIGVLVFAGLTAWDTQKIKLIYRQSDSQEIAGKKALMGALSLYLDFINMFLFLLRLFGNRN